MSDNLELTEALKSAIEETGIASSAILVSLAREGWLSEKHKKSEVDSVADRLIAQESKPSREG